MTFKFLKIKACNFKAFEDIDFDCKNNDVIVFGGKNGFGKTTLFDIIELALTGEIHRYKSYTEWYLDKRIQKEGCDKPIVHDENRETISVEVVVLWDSNQYSFYREAKTSKIKAQLDFSLFSNVIVKQKVENDKWIKIDKERINLADLKSNYARYYYVSQEETLSYLKTKEKDRSTALQHLFDVSFFDERKEAVKLVLENVKNQIQETQKQIEEANEKINDLVKLRHDESFIPFEKLADTVDLAWDVETPSYGFDYQTILGEEGVIKGLLYYVHNQQAYHAFRKNRYLEILDRKKEDLAFFLHYKNFYKDIQEYESFKKDCILAVDQLSIDSIKFFSLEKLNITNASEKESLQLELNALKLAEKSLTGTNRLFSVVEELRSFIFSHKDELNDVTECPLCGYNYNTSVNLWSTVIAVGEKNLSFSSLKNSFKNEIEAFKKRIDTIVIKPKLDYYTHNKINDDVVKKFWNIKFEEMSYLKNQLAIDINEENSIDEIIDKISSYIQENKVVLDESLNYKWMDDIYNEAVCYIKDENLTEEKIKAKEQYLLNQRQKECNKTIHKLQDVLSSLEKRLKGNKKLEIRLKDAEKELECLKRKYLVKVLGDIKVLFYIYSGRIMQDCFYGRGLFLIYNEEKNYINFTTSPDSCVDALYNLSSGQLVALILAFTMSLNKLYRKHDFMLIDDPIQCIDDINIWGFIETLRHEFQGYSFLFSTHESQYGSLLNYRLDNFGFKAEYRDLFKEGRRR